MNFSLRQVIDSGIHTKLFADDSAMERSLKKVIGLSALLLLAPCYALTQLRIDSSASTGSLQMSIPRVIRLEGTLSGRDDAPRTGTVGLTLAIYKEQQGGAALWQEVQNVTPDSMGHYALLLGANNIEGLPLELFSSGEARWLGIQVQGETEQPRTLLVAVPYALKAADAETLGGKPPSAFVTSEQLGLNFSSVVQSRVQTSVVSGGIPLAANVTGSGSQNMVAKFDASGTNLINSLLFDDGNHIGLGTQSPFFQFDEQNNDTSAAGANLFRIQTSSVNGATMHFISTSPNGRHFGFGSNFILGNGEFGIFDYTANANRFLIAANGSIGIGTNTPQFNFDLQNSDATAAGSNIFRLRTPSVNGAVMHFQSTSANGHDWAFGSNFIVGNGEFGVFDYTANASRLFLDTSGNLGIGTTSPGAMLDVNGMIHAGGGVKFPDGQVQSAAIDATKIPFLGHANNFTSDQTIAGNLTVSGTISGNGSGLASVPVTSGSPNYIQNGTSAQNASFNITGSGFIGGNVGIGTSTAGQKLTVAGTIASTSGGFEFPDGTIQVSAATSANLTASIVLPSGTSVASGTCLSQGVPVNGATTGMAVVISPAGDPSAKGLNELLWGAFVDSSNHVTAQFCHFSRSSATASASQTFNIRVLN
jgi:hypothetical protein